MTSNPPNHIALAEYFCSRDAIPPISSFALRVAYQVSIWSTRAKTRTELRKLDAAHLRDVGLSPRQALIECRKPFWRA